MDSSETTLSGVVDKVVALKPETAFVVLAVRVGDEARLSTVVGQAIDARPGQVVRAEGVWQESESWGRQFRARQITLLNPQGAAGLVSFLASGAIKGVGENVARKLVDHFGEDLAGVIDGAPERLAEVPGVGKKLAERIGNNWRQEKDTRDVLMFLHGHGVSPARARRILEAYGDEAMARLMADPYLLARDIRGIGFKTADALAGELGFAPTAEVRKLAALNEALRLAAEDGHTVLPRQATVAAAAALIEVGVEAMEGVVERALAERRLQAASIDGEPVLQLRDLAAAEEHIAARFAALAARAPAWDTSIAFDEVEAKLEIVLAPSQRAALEGVLGANVSIVTGGPGTGKTTLVRAILAILEKRELEIALCAPTGRAARRITESTGHAASTIHRLIEADPARRFGRNAERPLEVDLVIVDEVSMVDTLLMKGLLDALPAEAGLVLVGDVDQLPPVGPGQPLADMIASGRVAVFRLEEIFRQAAQSGIVQGAHSVIAGRMPAFRSAESPDCFGIRAVDVEDATDKLVQLVSLRIPERFEFDPVDDIQVVAPVNRGPAGTRALNERLQRMLNPAPPAVLEKGGTVFSVGDKVMQTENDNAREVYNGDIGRIVAVDTRARLIDVKFDHKTLLYGFDDLDQLVLAYAVTVHKAQGSEYQAVVLLLLRAHGRMLRRQLLYTAMTRAKRLLVVVTQGDALERAVRTPLPPRRSRLASLLGKDST
ncbi:MAG: ATP-dependent RecD-like DNA helicase [Geminicoccaceae bacterium]|nr:ATP-dependent RecD-like DNA helicase [Geminicoccaceae bacterium]